MRRIVRFEHPAVDVTAPAEAGGGEEHYDYPSGNVQVGETRARSRPPPGSSAKADGASPSTSVSAPAVCSNQYAIPSSSSSRETKARSVSRYCTHSSRAG